MRHDFPTTPPKRFLHAAALLAAIGAAHAATGTITLAINPDGGTNNRIAITIRPNNQTALASSSWTDLTGTVEATIDVDPATGQPQSISLQNGQASATNMRFRKLNTAPSYDILFSGLGFAIDTPAPPSIVTNPAAGEFDAADHAFTINQGTATGYVLSGITRTNINESFAPPNEIVGAGTGTGTVVLTPAGSSGGYLKYHVSVTFPISGDETITGDSGTIRVISNGNIQAKSPINPSQPEAPENFLWIPEAGYTAWTVREGIIGAPSGGDVNHDGLPNGIAWAMGLGADDDGSAYRPHPLSTGGFEITLPAAGTTEPLDIEVWGGTGDWLPLPAGRCSAGVNPLPAGANGTVTVTPSGAGLEFLRLRAPE